MDILFMRLIVATVTIAVVIAGAYAIEGKAKKIRRFAELGPATFAFGVAAMTILATPMGLGIVNLLK